MSAFVLIEKRLEDIAYLVSGHKNTINQKQSEIETLNRQVTQLQVEEQQLKEHLGILVADIDKKTTNFLNAVKVKK